MDSEETYTHVIQKKIGSEVSILYNMFKLIDLLRFVVRKACENSPGISTVEVKILQRNANLDGTSANAGPPPEQARDVLEIFFSLYIDRVMV